ncbi:MAG: long-chain-fatty-acid--CoA ligase [Gammaproteobacteria bacterium]|nr:long-chain-fatty-acid--CoA ligase [Gammaproteobacteria bacterium]
MFDLTALHTIADVTRIQARERPDQTAQIFEDRSVSYAALDRHTSQIAQGLLGLGLSPQARVGFLGKNSDRYFELLLGAIKARLVVVGVNWRLVPPEISYVLNDAACAVLFVGAEYVGLVDELQAACPSLHTIIVMDGAQSNWPGFDAWRDAQSPRDPELTIPLDDDVLQLYTSGTTGHPKGVQLTHANYLCTFAAAQAAGWSDCQPGEVALTCMPVFHVAGSNMGLVTLAQGGTSVIMKEVDPLRILEFIPRYRVNLLFLVPAAILFMLQHPAAATTDFSSVRRLSYGASPIAEALLLKAKALLQCEFIQLYGLTETTGAGAYLPDAAHDPARGKLRACGVPYPGINIQIMDEHGAALPSGAVGEIAIQSGVVMKGYWNKPEATAKAIVKQWFYTGDAGYFDTDGYLYIHDRVKDMIVSGGENIYPAEVENALFGHPAVADVAVIGVPDDKWGEAVKAVIVLKPETPATADELIDFARSRIAGYKLPKSVDFAAALPRNPSGKVLRRELREPFWVGIQRRVN